MSIERTELARDWEAAYNAEVPVIDFLFDAGYRKPRTITTAEELDALPTWSIVIDAEDVPSRHEGFDMWSFFDSNTIYGSAEVILPATVLHEGAQS